MNMMKKMGLMLFVMALLLAACGKGGNDGAQTASKSPPASTSSASSSASSEAPPENVELTFAQWGTAEQVAATQKVLDIFMQENPSIKVNLVYKDWGSYWTWITTQAASKDLPDVYKMSFAYVEKYAKLGAMKPLDDLISSSGFDLAGQFEQALLAMHQSDGKQVSLPRDANTVVFYYNKDLFDAAGIPYPNQEVSWDEVLEMAKKLTLDDKGNDANSASFNPKKIVQWGLVTDAAGMGDAVLEPQLWSNDARLVKDGKLALSTPEAMQVLNFFKDLTVKHHVNPTKATIDGVGGNPILAFGTGKFAMGFGGSWSATDFADASFKFGAVLPPKFKAVTTVVQPAGYAMSPFTKKEAAAWKLISWLSGKEGQIEQAKLNDGIPANKLAEEAYVTGDMADLKKLFLGAQARAIPSPWYDGEDRLMWEFLPQKLALPLQGDGEISVAVKEVEDLMAGS